MSNATASKTKTSTSTIGSVFITGATSGIGRSSALDLASRGYHVIASGRRTAELDALRTEARAAGYKLDTVTLDVTSQPSITAAVAEVERLTERRGVDVLVNNAGYGLVGPLAEISDEAIRAQFDTNVFGLMAVTRAFLPQLRARGTARIINVSSVGGHITLPFMAAYTATKHAVESLSDGLRLELRPFGIQVSLIEPGAINTGFNGVALSSVDAYRRAGSEYAGALERADEVTKRFESMAVGPEVIAKAIRRAIKARRPKARYVAPFSAALMLGLYKRLPTRWTDALLRRMTHLRKDKLLAAGTEAARLAQPQA
jgi:short-subunit dehydrogenase